MEKNKKLKRTARCHKERLVEQNQCNNKVYYRSINMMNKQNPITDKINVKERNGKTECDAKGTTQTNHNNIQSLEKSVGTTELHYSTKKRYHVLTILTSLFSSDTRQSMKRRNAPKHIQTIIFRS